MYKGVHCATNGFFFQAIFTLLHVFTSRLWIWWTFTPANGV